MSIAAKPWKLYLVVTAIVCLLVGAGVSWVVKPLVEAPPAWVSLEEYEEVLRAGAYPFPGMPPSNYTGTLTVFTWTGLGREDPMWWNVGPWGFNKIYPNVEVKWLYFEDEPSAMSMLKMNPDLADVIEVCGAQFKLLDEGLIGPLNSTWLPLLAEFFPEWDGFYAFWKDGEFYGVPIEFGYTSLTYRKTGPNSFTELGISEELWNDTAVLFEDIPALEGKIWMYDSVIEIMDLVGVHAGYNVTVEDMTDWTLNETKWAKIKETLWGFKPKVAKFYEAVEEAYSALWYGDTAAVLGWNDMYACAKAGPDEEFGTDDDVDVGFSMFSPMFSWGTAYTISAGLKERDPELYAVAHAFLNAEMAREAQANKITEWYEGAPNRYSYEIVSEEFPEFMPIIEELHLNDPVFFTEESAYWIEPPTEVIDKWEEVWLEFKA